MPCARVLGTGSARQTGSVENDLGRIRSALTDAGVPGVEDLGRFVNNTEYFPPSRFDERAAMPVLLRFLPTLTDPRAVEVVARHLHGPWARPHTFLPLLEAFRSWGSQDWAAGWVVGDSLASAATLEDSAVLIDLVRDQQYGSGRQMIVYSLWRFRSNPGIAEVLEQLIDDPDVCLQAMSALRRTVGNGAALPHLRRIRDTHADARVRSQASAAVKKAEKSLAGQA